MSAWLDRWRRGHHRRQFIKAYKILRKTADRHRVAGHDVEFTAVNESHVIMRCSSCPDLMV